MGYEYAKRPVGQTGGSVQPVETFTLANAAANLSAKGVTFLNYASSNVVGDAILPSPDCPGQVKEVFLIKGATSEEASVFSPAGTVFSGTTFNTITIAASTVQTAGTPYLRFVAKTSTEWAATVGSTVDWDFATSTGSTAQ